MRVRNERVKSEHSILIRHASVVMVLYMVLWRYVERCYGVMVYMVYMVYMVLWCYGIWYI